MSNIVETITEMVIPILDEQDFELVEVEFVKEGKSQFLRVFIGKKGGIDIEGCAFVSKKLGEKPDATDPNPIPQAYLLEVSSSGAERPLKEESDYEKVLGDCIHVSLYQSVDGEKRYEGFLQSFDAGRLTLEIRIRTRKKESIPDRKNIAKARLAIQFQSRREVRKDE